MERIKSHIRKYKTVYCCVATGTVVAVITGIIMRGRHAGIIDVPDTADQMDTVFVRPVMKYLPRGWFSSQREEEDGFPTEPQASAISFIFGDSNSIDQSTHIYERFPALSYIVADNETNRWWVSQAEAARELGYYESDISKHINHGKPLPGGEMLTRVGIAA